MASEAQRAVNAAIAGNEATKEEDEEDLIYGYSKAIKKAIKIWQQLDSNQRRLMTGSGLKGRLCEIEEPHGSSLRWIVFKLQKQTFDLKIRFARDYLNPDILAHAVVLDENCGCCNAVSWF